jgi:hypothetical protein
MFPLLNPAVRVALVFGMGEVTSSMPVSAAGVSPPQPALGADSVEVLRHAQGRQARFERLRRDRLPWTYSSSGRCDVRIGRYCFRFDHGEPAWEPPPEHTDVVAAREDLIGFLDSAQRVMTGDAWLTTQLIRYLIEDDQPEAAREVVSRCTVQDTWLCPALEGFVAHRRGAYQDAEDAFDRALAGMTPDQRCEWDDLSDLVPSDVRGRFRSLECVERGPLLDTLFWLADPLYTVPGNELRAEHYARHVVSVMHRQAKGPDPDGWNESTHRITLRYGAPRGWQRIRGSPAELRPSLVTHYGTNGSAFFFPERDFVEKPDAIPADGWVLDEERPQSNHDPAYAANGFQDMTAEFAMFRQADSTIVVGTSFLSHDSVRAGTETRFAMVMTTGPHQTGHRSSKVVHDTTAVLLLTGAPRSYLVSVEALAPASKVAGRVRQGLDLRRVHGEGLVASDILVLNPCDSLPHQLSDAVPHLRESGPFRAGERFTLYWELYGLDPANTIHSTTISLDKTSKGVFRRLAELTPFASHQPTVHVAWDETAPRNMTTLSRGLVVDLPDDLSNGEYRLTISVETPAGESVERTVKLTSRS